jgi:hypothetical protein
MGIAALAAAIGSNGAVTGQPVTTSAGTGTPQGPSAPQPPPATTQEAARAEANQIKARLDAVVASMADKPVGMRDAWHYFVSVLRVGIEVSVPVLRRVLRARVSVPC